MLQLTTGCCKVLHHLSCWSEVMNISATHRLWATDPLTPHHHLQHDPRFFPPPHIKPPPPTPSSTNSTSNHLPANTTLWSAIQAPTLPQQFQPAGHTQGYFCSACINHWLPRPSSSSPSPSAAASSLSSPLRLHLPCLH